MRYLFLLIFISHVTFSQDSVYARKAIKYLTSEKCQGRGYVKNGANKAADYLIKQIKESHAKPLFGKDFKQPFYFNVNTFPDIIDVTVNGKKLRTGFDYIINPDCPDINGKFEFLKKDSVTFYSSNKKCFVKLSKKLTYSVATSQSEYCVIELLQDSFKRDISSAEIKIRSKLIENYKAYNIGACIDGVNNDSTIVFTAHYDHLGMLGKHCYFPGANDNASGVSILLNLIRHYSLNKPKYRTVFVFFAGEEAGLLGSEYFVKNKSIELSKIKFLVNLDLMGTGDDGIMVVNGAVFKREFEMLKGLNDSKKFLKEIKMRGKAKNSDHYWFTENGVPCFFIYTLGGIKAYHDVYDVETTLPLTKYKEVFQLLTEFVMNL